MEVIMKRRSIYKLVMLWMLVGSTTNLFGMQAAAFVLTRVNPISVYAKYYQLLSLGYKSIFQYGFTKLLTGRNTKSPLGPQADYIEHVYETAHGIPHEIPLIKNDPINAENFAGNPPAPDVITQPVILQSQNPVSLEDKLAEIRGVLHECKQMGIRDYTYEKILSLNDLCIQGDKVLDRIFQKAKYEILEILCDDHGEFKGLPDNKAAEKISKIIAQFERDIHGKIHNYDPNYISKSYNPKFTEKIRSNAFNQDVFNVIDLCKKGKFQQAAAIVKKYYNFAWHKKYNKTLGKWGMKSQEHEHTNRHDIIKNVFDQRFCSAQKLAERVALQKKVEGLVAQMMAVLDSPACTPLQREDALSLLDAAGTLLEQTIKKNAKAEKELAFMLSDIEKMYASLAEESTQTSISIAASTKTDSIESAADQPSVDFVATTKESIADLTFDQQVLEELIADKALAQELQEILKSKTEEGLILEFSEKEVAEIDQACKEIIEALRKQYETTVDKYAKITEGCVIEHGEKLVENIKHPVIFAQNLLIDSAKIVKFALRLKLSQVVYELDPGFLLPGTREIVMSPIRDVRDVAKALYQLPFEEKYKLLINTGLDVGTQAVLFHGFGKLATSIERALTQLKAIEKAPQLISRPHYLAEVKKLTQVTEGQLVELQKLGKSLSGELSSAERAARPLDYGHSAIQYEQLKGALQTEEFTSIVKVTKHGLQRLIERGFSPDEVLSLLKKPDFIKIQTDGAKAFIKYIGENRYNFMAINEKTGKVISVLRQVSENKIIKLGKNYGWSIK
jgi:hypothetical protein